MMNWTRQTRGFGRITLIQSTLFFLFCYHAVAQDAVLRGKVIDHEQNVALVGANVRVSGNRIEGTSTDVEGLFELPITAGSHSLQVSYLGYDSFEVKISLSPGEERFITIRLRASEFQVNPVTITASRRPEKLLDAPASITVLGPRTLQSRTVLTAAQHLKYVPGVDLIKTGLVTSRIVIRGFNDNLASSLLTLVDNRIARAPAIRLTALQLIPLTDGDVEKMEIVSGPASALYGPNAANGVVHIITRGPFDSPGTRISLAGGEQSVRLGSIRQAGLFRHNIGYKFAVQYYEGSDFEFIDPIELEERATAISSGASPDTLRIGARNFDVRNFGFSGRLDFKLASDILLILSGGLTQGDNIEVTPTGAAQVNDARISYVQARLTYRDFFFQAYGNFLNSGDSFFLRTGEVFKDRSKQLVVQAQHFAELGDGQRFTYGTDLFYTVPEGEGTITGRFEDRDEIFEIGGYIQSETEVTAKLKLVTAARLDYHDRMDTWTLSPRAALVFKPRPEHTFRATFNNAFQTPTAQQLFADLVGLSDVFQLGQLSSTLGFPTSTDLRVQGLISGFQFRSSPSGVAMYRSPFAPLVGADVSQYFELGDPSMTEVMWDIARFATVEGLAQNLSETGLITAEQVQSVREAMDAVLPSDVGEVGNIMKLLDIDTQLFHEVKQPMNFAQLKVTRTRTIELGYKGVISKKLVWGLDLYHTNVKNFLGPFEVGTPNVFLDPTGLNGKLVELLELAFDDPSNAEAREALIPLDEIPLLGNGDGSAARELAGLISTGVAAAIPFGTVSPIEAFDPTAVLLLRRNFGNISVRGLDAHFNLFLSHQIQLNGFYSYISDNYFENVEGIDDISLNAPRHKAGGTFYYNSRNSDYSFSAGARFVDAYSVKSDVYIGDVNRFAVFDASVNYRVPFSADTNVNLTIQNLTNNKHQEFVFSPEIGRLAMVRVTHEF